MTENRPDGFEIGWQSIKEATEYEVTVEKDYETTYYSDTGKREPALKFVTNATNFDLENLDHGTTYKYTVTARNEFAQSEPFISYKTTLLPDIVGSVIQNVTYGSFQAGIGKFLCELLNIACEKLIFFFLQK